MPTTWSQAVVNVARDENVSNADLARVFAEAGWTLNLAADRPMPPAPVCATERLRALGVTPSDARILLRDALSAPGFFQG